MFKKEAEDNKPPYAFCAFDTKCELWKDGFQKGAEFGYNKAKVEVEESYRESLCNSELNLASVTEQLEELEKANEWHYVKDGDLPKENMKQVMVITNYNECLMGWYCIHKKTWYSSDCPDPDDYIETEDILKVKVIKWKEIVLPNIKED